ncbi:uncharacterized protein LOC6641430 [Drosophila willistoni]|uniref:uncharacterized protein LOC6641430 n=1 Tax=Drosophila willistoni TaxID=7260 RepID=UPI000C26C373|nr:uncharacterized protein LOC6641430 [Drosophila willistoni]
MLNVGLFYVLNCLLLLVQCQGELSAGQTEIASPASRLEPSVCRNGSLSVEIKVPFMDMELHHDRPLFLLRELDEELDLVLVLHGHELFQLQVSNVDKRLVRLGELGGRVREQDPVGVSVVGWHQYLLFTITLDNSQLVEVYQLAKEEVLRTDMQQKFDPIQEFTLPGKFLQMELLKPNTNQIMLLITMNYTRTNGKCKTFEWLDTYFNPLEELTLPTIQTFQVVGRKPLYILSGRLLRGSQSKLVLTIYEIEATSMRLQRRQSLTVAKGRQVMAARFRGRNCIIACGTTPNSCIFFRMIDGQFVVYRKHTLRDLQFSHLAAARKGQLLIGARPNGDVMVFNTARLDCYSGFSDTHKAKGFFSHRNQLNETFLLMAYRQDTPAGASVIRMIQLGGGENDTAILGATAEINDDLTMVQQHRHEFEVSINSLRSHLLRRKLQMDHLRRLNQQLKEQSMKLEQTLHLNENHHVDQVQVEGFHLRTPSQLKERLDKLRHNYRAGVRQRSARSFLVGHNESSMENLIEILKVKRLHVKNLIYHDDILPGYHLEAANRLHVKGHLLTKKLNTNKLWLQKPKQTNTDTEDSVKDLFSENTLVRHLQVERINNITWSDLYNSLFLRSRDKLLKGRLIVQSKARVLNLQADLLNGRMVQKLFNTRQTQTVNSNIFMSAFFAPRLEVNLINGLNFAKDIVIRGAPNAVIKTPVRINQMFVAGDIHIANQSESRQMESPRQQYYTGHVIINGSLWVNSLQRDVNTTRIMLDQQSLDKKDLQSEYLLLQTPQNLSKLIISDAKVILRSLHTNTLNGHPLNEYLLSNGQSSMTNQTLRLVFMNASIDDDVVCRDQTSILADLSKEVVRKGQMAEISGLKIFKSPVRVMQLTTERLNDLSVDELVQKSKPHQDFKSTKSYAGLIANNMVNVEDSLSVQRLNGLPLNQISSVKRLELGETPYLKDLHIKKLNFLPFDQMLPAANPTNESAPQLTLRKQLLVEGNVRFEQNLQLETINDLKWNDYIKDLVRPDLNTVLLDRKTFLEDVRLTDALATPHMNGLDLSSMLDNTLLRTTPQKINGEYTFQKLTTTNLDVSSVNGVPANEFLDTQQKDIQLHGDLYLIQLNISGDLNCQLTNNFNINETLQQVDHLKRQELSSRRKVMVIGDAIWPMKKETLPSTRLDYLRRHGVLRGKGDNQTINGHVTLRNPHIRAMQSTHDLPINGLNFTHLAADALLRPMSDHNKSQVIMAPIQFLQSVEAKSIHLLNDSNFELLNGIDLKRLNASLYRPSIGAPIQADLRFTQSPPFFDHLTTEGGGLINGVSLTNAYQLGKHPWPSTISFKQLKIQNDLNLDSVNGMNLQYFFDTRIPLRGPALEVFGTLSFENLKLGQNANLHTINGIQLDNVVYRQSNQLQAITGAKTFAGGLALTGPVHIMRLNGRDLSESFRETIFTNQNYNIDSLLLDKADFPAGLQWQKETMETDSYAPSGELRFEQDTMEMQLNMNASHTKRLLYLDFDEELYKVGNISETFDLKAQVMAEATPSICQRIIVEARIHLANKMVQLSNESQSQEPLRVESSPIRMKVINYCPPLDPYARLRLRSKISFTCREITHNLGMRQYVEELQLHRVIDGYQLMLLRTTEEVRILRANLHNCSLSDWQSIGPEAEAGRLMKLFDIGNITYLLVSGESPKLSIYQLNSKTQQFQLQQIIENDYDLVEITTNQQLILSCRQCKHLDIYDYQPREEKFKLLQKLSLQEDRIEQLLLLTVGNAMHLMVLTQPGSKYFYVFTYAHIEGWQQSTYGLMGEYQRAWPLIDNYNAELQETGVFPILLLCGLKGCKLIKALVR